MNKLLSLWDFLGLSTSKEISKIVLINVLLICFIPLVYFLHLHWYFYVVIGLFIAVVDYLIFSTYLSKKALVIKNRDDEFIALLSYFKVIISNNYNVYSALTKLMDYASDWMKEQLSNLIKDIDKDKSVTPFVHFAHLFHSLTIESIMISIYQMIEDGTNQSVDFDALLNELAHSYILSKIEHKKSSLAINTILPLVGAGLITIILTFAIIALIGEMNYV